MTQILGPKSDGRRNRKWSRGFQRKKDCEADLVSFIAQLHAGTFVEPVKITVEQWLRRWLRDFAEHGVAGKTLERYEEIVDSNIVPALGRYALSKLHAAHIQSFYSDCLRTGRKRGKGGLSAQTVVHIHRVLRKALQEAVDLDLLNKNPAAKAKPPRIEPREMRTLNEAEGVWMLQAARGTRLYLPIVLAYTTGMRRGEILGLRWPDIDWVASKASINQSLEQTNKGLRFKASKNKKRRPVDLPQFALAMLNDHREQQRKERELFGDDYADTGLVCARHDGTPWPPDSFSAEFRRFRDRVGLKISFHELRHTHASHLLQQNTNPKVVSERLGHSSIGITLNLYSHVMPGIQEEAAKKFDLALKTAMERHRVQ